MRAADLTAYDLLVEAGVCDWCIPPLSALALDVADMTTSLLHGLITYLVRHNGLLVPSRTFDLRSRELLRRPTHFIKREGKADR